jgi:hypothetical protein
MVEANLNLSVEAYSQEVAQDVLQYLRGIVGWGIHNHPPLDSLIGQRVSIPGYRWTYWTPMLDFVGNPCPHPYGSYSLPEPDEAVGPGFTTVENILGFRGYEAVSARLGEEPGDLSNLFAYMRELHLSLVWSQAFSMPRRTTATADAERIRRRVQEIRRHWNSHNELSDAEGHLSRHDVKGAVRSAASAVDAALRFYCAEWNVRFPDSGRFESKIEEILRATGRPSYRAASPSGSRSILHLYRVRNAMHEGDVYYSDAQSGDEIRVDMSLAPHLIEEAKAFVLWLDSHM